MLGWFNKGNHWAAYTISTERRDKFIVDGKS
jgi:hypothetical protein